MTAFQTAILGDTPGYVFVGRGVGGAWKDGKYKHAQWVERAYPWPSELAFDTSDDVYFCPYVHSSDKRTKGGSIGRRWLHADLDYTTPLDFLQAVIVKSGSSEHSHMYIALDREVTLEEHDRLERLLRDAVGGDNKISDNDYLRLPGTINHKTGKDVKIATDKWQVWSIDILEPLLSKVGRVRKAKRTDDRSLDIFNVVRMGKDEGLDKEIVLAIVRSEPALKEKLDSVGGDDFERVWDKLSVALSPKMTQLLAEVRGELAAKQRSKMAELRRLTIKLAGARVPREAAWSAIRSGAVLCGLGSGDVVSEAFAEAWDVAAAEEFRGDEDDSNPFVTPKGRLLTATFAADIIADGPLAMAPGGGFAAYLDERWKEGEEELSQRITHKLDDHYTPGHENTVRKFMSPNLPKLSVEPISQYINFKNVLLDWKTGEELAHTPDFLSPLQLPVKWIPGSECPAVDKWVTEVMHADATELFWQIVGYAMFSGNPQQIAILLYGDGGNGKGTFLRLIEKLVGPDNCSHVTLDNLADNRFAGVDMYGKLVNIAGDLDPTYQKKTASLKSITGGDTVRAEQKNQRAFNFTPFCTPFFSVNEFFGAADTSHGYARRWVPFDFPNKFIAGSDPDLEKRFEDELEGVAYKAVCALQRMASNGGRFATPPSAVRAKQEMWKHIDVVARWIDEDTEDYRGEDDGARAGNEGASALAKRVGDETEKPMLYADFTVYCKNEMLYVLGRNKFYARIKSKGFVTCGDKDQYFRGLKLKSVLSTDMNADMFDY